MLLSLLTALVLLLSVPSAQGAFEDLGSGARAPGMGNAFTAVADDATAVFYNPAGLAQLQRPVFTMSYAKLNIGLTDNSDFSLGNFAYAYPVQRLKGTLGASHTRYALAGLYEESTYALSYARPFEFEQGLLFAGANAKFMGHSFSPGISETQAKDANLNIVGADPVLQESKTHRVPDADLGLLLRMPNRVSVGLAVSHLLEPNVAFARDTDKVSRAYRLGLAYKSLWLNIATDIKLEKTADGGMYREVSVGGERYYPTLNHGQFAVRGGLAFGSLDVRQLSMGGAYRINKLQFDYAFFIPLGGVPGGSGSHRFGVTLHFGAPTPEEEYSRKLAAMINQKTEVEGYAYEFEGVTEKSPLLLSHVVMSTATALIKAGEYRKAYNEVRGIVASRATKVAVLGLASRLEEVSAFYPVLDVQAHPTARVLGHSIEDYLEGRDRDSVLRASYALSLTPSDVLRAWLTRLEQNTDLKAHYVPAGSGMSLLQAKMQDSEIMFLSKNFKEAETLIREVLVLDPKKVKAMARLGSVLYAQQRFNEALVAWEKALFALPDAQEEQNIRYMIRQAQKKLEESLTSPATVPAETAIKPLEKPPQKIKKEKVDPWLLEELYRRGVELYTTGQKVSAAEIFQRILKLDPKNVPARKALDRLEKELMLSPGDPP